MPFLVQSLMATRPLRLFSSCLASLHHGKSSSTGNLLESDQSLPTPDYGLTARLLAQSLAQTRPRPYSMAGFGTQVGNKSTQVVTERIWQCSFLAKACCMLTPGGKLTSDLFWDVLSFSLQLRIMMAALPQGKSFPACAVTNTV